MKSILVADDVAEILEMFQEVFAEDKRYILTVVKDGQEASEKIQSQAFDAIILDYRMPKMSGVEVAAQIRANDLNKKAFLAIFSGHLNSDALEKLEKLSMIQVFRKPHPIRDLKAKIDAQLDHINDSSPYSQAFNDLLLSVTKKTINYFLNDQLHYGEMKSLNLEPMDPPTYASMITLYGSHVYGSIILGFDEPTLKKAVVHLFGKEASTRFDQLAVDLLLELGNNLGGSLKRKLEQVGVQTRLGLPFTIGVPYNHMISGPVWYVPFQDKLHEMKFSSPALCRAEFCLGVAPISVSRPQIPLAAQ